MSLIQSSFCHLPGIGIHRERALWTKGILSWNQLEQALLAGVKTYELFSEGPLQLSLFSAPPLIYGKTVDDWIRVIDESRTALEGHDWGFFLNRLPDTESWRVLADNIGEALFLDIETTGLSKEVNYVTVIGAFTSRRFYQWVWPEKVDELWELLEDARLLVTFNGARFDLPFLASQFPGKVRVPAHVDLLRVARRAGFRGSQKVVERQCGLSREESIRRVTGAKAVVLWSRALYGDPAGLEELLLYNKNDVLMMGRLAARFCSLLVRGLPSNFEPAKLSTPKLESLRSPATYKEVSSAWVTRRSHLSQLLGPMTGGRTSSPTVVGLDLRGNSSNPTGLAVCTGSSASTWLVYDDRQIIEAIEKVKPCLVSIDAPLSLPKGRFCVNDDSPCRATGGIVRAAERILWRRGIPVYPALIRHMQALTKRGIELADKIGRLGIQVIESYPGAAQDIIGIARKGVSVELLRLGLMEFGFEIQGGCTHDELDAVTSALVGYYFLADEYEPLGADDEGYLVVPYAPSGLRWHPETDTSCPPDAIILSGEPGSGKSELAFRLSIAFRSPLVRCRHHGVSAGWSGSVQPIERLEQLSRKGYETLILDDPPDQVLSRARGLLNKGVVVSLSISKNEVSQRLGLRLNCRACGWSGTRANNLEHFCPVCHTELAENLKSDSNPAIGANHTGWPVYQVDIDTSLNQIMTIARSEGLRVPRSH